ncbi:MAG TPA: FIST N-terminal domain-containing protein [Gemmatimonadaceae bacterium]|nr:FIST N-terminal domain-containing protein [Gemmatimonadaceae bacterium]
MTSVAVASTGLRDREAGTDLADQIRNGLGGDAPDAVLVFASSQNDYEPLLEALQAGCNPAALIGCSSAGEFTETTDGMGRSSAIALRAPEMRFTAVSAQGLATDHAAAARKIVRGFSGLASAEYRYRTAIILLDALAGHAEEIVDEMTQETGGMYRFAGGGAGDDGKFSKTHVFHGVEAHTDAVVALEILSNKPIGIGSKHGWGPSGDVLRITESAQSCVLSFNVAPAVEAFEEHAALTGQTFDHADPLPFFLHNIVGVTTEQGHKLRVPLGIAPGGGIVHAAEIPIGTTAHIMSIPPTAAVEAATSATLDAIGQVAEAGHRPSGALFLDCVATRLRLGHGFDDELAAVSNALGNISYAGFNSYGQIVRAEGQFSGFHNCTAVVVVFPE